ncbi:ABC transporter permease [uncultured Tyzzerella sp.]|uniref:ABC transporter permease n=1 Tax=uncultured Tyzzerella sp. TaxID=2321398 RepID=UPI0029427896|nr:ABC transporter permease [uncultured Tyzzerella sp.]
MNIFENISAAISSVFSNKMRTFLTMIGIIIGVSSVITITALGKGFENTISTTFEILNSKAIQIMKNWGSGLTAKDKIFLEDSDNIKKHPNVKSSSAYFSSRASITLKNPDEEKALSIFGSEVEFSNMQKNFFRIKYGRVFTEKEDDIKAKVCIIDENIAMEVFGRKDVVGERVNLFINNKDYDFEVVGVTSGENAVMMGSIISMPINTILDIHQTEEIDMLYVELHDTENLTRSKNEIIRMLASNHNTTDDKYMALSNMEQVEIIEKVINMFTMFIGFVAGISLLVGGIGVMNIMLVTVTERTKEIGIRKSLGATNRNIKTQFLIESMFICALGGIIGILFGYVVSMTLGHYLNVFFTVNTGMEMKPPELSITVAIGAMIISTIVGVIFGVYPAGKAAKLDPIECLRYE